MSDANILLGFITEPYPALQEDRSVFARLNDSVLAELPADDEWPQLCKAMFSVTAPDTKHGSFRGQRLIHFAGHFNGLGDGLDDWLEKFERFLRRLFWQDATVFLLQTWSAQEVRLSYRLGADTFDRYRDATPTPPDRWEFSGINLTPPEDRHGGDYLAELLKCRAARAAKLRDGPTVE